MLVATSEVLVDFSASDAASSTEDAELQEALSFEEGVSEVPLTVIRAGLNLPDLDNVEELSTECPQVIKVTGTRYVDGAARKRFYYFATYNRNDCRELLSILKKKTKQAARQASPHPAASPLSMGRQPLSSDETGPGDWLETVCQSPGVLGAEAESTNDPAESPARPVMGDSLNLELAGGLDQAEIDLEVEQNSIFAATCEITTIPPISCQLIEAASIEPDVSWAAGATPEEAPAAIELEVEQNSIFTRDEDDVIVSSKSESCECLSDSDNTESEVHKTEVELAMPADESVMEQAAQESPQKTLGRDQWA